MNDLQKKQRKNYLTQCIIRTKENAFIIYFNYHLFKFETDEIELFRECVVSRFSTMLILILAICANSGW